MSIENPVLRGKIVAIYISPQAGAPMLPVDQVVALKDCGLEGDRYALARGSWNNGRSGRRQVSFMEIEALEANSIQGGPSFSPDETRRNIITEDVDLSRLINREFWISRELGLIADGAQFFGTKPCEPCSRPDQLSGKKGFKEAFSESGGILADVISSRKYSTGIIRVGDLIWM